jgi:hypothetical protein
VGTVLSVLGSLLIGGIAATATVIGVVSSQTSTSGPSPADVQQPVVVEYGTTN